MVRSGVSSLVRIAAGPILCGRNFDPCSDMRTRQLEAREKSKQKRIPGERKMMFREAKNVPLMLSITQYMLSREYDPRHASFFGENLVIFLPNLYRALKSAGAERGGRFISYKFFYSD